MSLLKKRHWLAIVSVFTLFFIISTIPAAWVIYGVQQSAPQFRVSGVLGSLWSGEVAYAQWDDQPLGQLQWYLSPLSLLSFSPCLQFALDYRETDVQSLQGRACYLSSGQVNLTHARVRFPAARLSPLLSASIDLQGELDATISQAAWQGNRLLTAQLEGVWREAGVFNGYQWMPLGDISVQANDDKEGGLQFQWKSLSTGATEPPISLAMVASIGDLTSAQPAIRITGDIKPGPQVPGLAQMLQLIGEPLPNGAYRVDINEQ